MPTYATFGQNSPKWCKNCPETFPLLGYKTLVLLKKRSKSTFQPMKVCSARCVWKYPGCILSVFMHFYEAPSDFWTVFFLLLLTFFDLCWGIFVHICDYIGPFLDHFWNRDILGWFWTNLEVDLRSFWGHFRVTFWSFSHRFGIVLVSFWPHFEAFLGYLPVWAIFGLFARFWAIFTVILRFLSDVLRSWLQN